MNHSLHRLWQPLTFLLALFALAPRILAALGCLLLALLSLPAGAQTITLTKSVVGTNGLAAPDPMPAGQEFDYVLSYTFSSTIGDFYNAVIRDVLPPGIVYSGAVGSSPHVANVSTPGSGSGGTVVFTMTEPLSAGSSGTLKIRARYPLGTTTNGLTRTNVTTASANAGSETGPVVNASSGGVTTTASAACLWTVSVTAPANVAVNQPVGIRVRLMRPSPNVGNYSVLTGSTLSATLPVGVTPADVLDTLGGTLTGTGLAGNPVVVTWPTGALNADGSDGGEETGRNLVIRFPAPPFSTGQTPSLAGAASLLLAAGGGSCAPTTTATVTLAAATTTGLTSKAASSASVNADGSSLFQWQIRADNTGRTALDNLLITDHLPVNFALQRILMPGSVSYPPATNFITVRYRRSDAGATLSTWPGGPFAVNVTLQVSGLALPAGVYVSYVEFDLGTVPVGFATGSSSGNRFRLEGTLLPIGWDVPPTVLVTGNTVCNSNILTATSSQPGTVNLTSAPVCVTATVPTTRPASTKAIESGTSPSPGGLTLWRVETSTGAGSALVNPMAMDLLPVELEYVPGTFARRTDGTYNSSGAGDPTDSLEVLPNYNGTGRTLLRWQYTNSFPENTRATVRFQTRLKAGVANGTSVTNRSDVWANPTLQNGAVILYASPVTDSNDLNGNGSTTDQIGQSAATAILVSASAALESRKLVKGALDTEYTRYPDFGFTVPGGAVDYRIAVFNNGSVNVTNIVLLDILPSIGDVGVIDPQPRLSAWTPLLTGPINVLVNGAAVPGTIVDYSTAANPCRPDFVPAGPVGCTAPGWSTSLPSPLSATRAFRVTFPATYALAAGDSMTIDIPMVAPMSFTPGFISWNSFAYRATPAAAGLPELKAEPIKVGVSAIPPYALGDYVWLDENSDGYQDAGEPGIPNVRVNLFATNGTFLATTLTDASGHYLFSGLLVDAAYVRVDESTLPPGMTQTPPSTLTNANFGNQDQSIGPDDYGYLMHVLTGIPNLTGDFGYNWNPTPDVLHPTNSPVAALGDRVWLDFNGNGRQDPDELGVRGATVQIFTSGPDGLFGTADDVPGSTRTTDANGNYMFDGLAPDAYVVKVVSDVGANYPILGVSYTQTGDPDAFGLPSVGDNATTVPVVLGPGDVFINADFGYQPGPGVTLGSLGDLVWLDINSSSNSVPDSPSEHGIAGVTVSLIRDVNGNGVWDNGEPIIATTTTDANGNYLFRGLPLSDDGDGVAGDADYLVWVNDTANHLANLVPTYDNFGAVNGLGRGVLTPGSPQDLTVDFSYKPQTQPGAPAVTTAVLGDTIWFDANRDGVQNPGESGIPGVLMELLHTTGSHIDAVAVTDPAGHYYFAGLDPTALYIVRVAAANFVDGGILAGLTSTFSPSGTPNVSTVNFAVNDGPNDPDGTRNFINLGQDFGYAAPVGPSGTIGNQFWVDSNANGIRNPNGADGIPGTDDDEPALPGVTVDLYRDLNLNGLVDPGEPLIATTISDVNGQYLFTGLPLTDGLYDRQVYASDPDASYVVNVSDRAGVLLGWWHSLGNQAQTSNDTSKLDPYGVTLTQTIPDVLTLDFGYYVEPAAVGNFTWLDTNGNGIQDAGEPGIDGLLMQNRITYPDGTITILKTITGDDPATPAVEQGWYWFGNLLQDEHYNGVNMTPTPTFEISVLTPTGTGPLTGLVVTHLNQGSDPKTDANDPAGTAGFPIKGITDMQPFASPDLQPMPASYDFGYVRTLSLGNRVWLDVNNNGQFSAGEAIVPGVKVELLAATNGSVIATAYTDANGYYRFDGLFPGDYQVRIAAENWTGIAGSPGGTLDGTKPLAACNSSTGNATTVETSGPGAVNNIDHGVDSATPATTGITSLVVTLGDGNQPTGDLDPGATGAGGHGENGDAYDNLALDFGFYRLSVGNLVFSDLNVDGFFDAGDAGVNGVRVELYAGSTLVAVITAAGGGAYNFTGETDAGGVLTGNPLLPGTAYTVQIPAAQPVLAGFYSTRDTAGTPNPNGGVDNDDNVVGIAPTTVLLGTPAFTLAAGAGAAAGTVVTAATGLTDQPTIDVGLAPATALVAFGNLVWLDTNANGFVDNSEAGITNVVVELYAAGQTPGTDAPLGTQITDADGRFYFNLLPPGSYFTHIPASQFLTGAVLTNLVSSPGAGTGAANDENVDENGLDSSPPATTGISSAVFELTPSTGPLGENAQNYTGSLPDANTTFTVDFGFAPTFSLGNRVFADNGAGGGVANNGRQDGTEPGIASVVVNLYAADGNGAPTGTLLGTQTTDANGWYRFDGLTAGSYVPVVDVTGSGAALTGLYSSTGYSTDLTLTGDLLDHGQDTPLGGTSALPGGIAGVAVTLGTSLQPTGEATGSGAGANGPTGDAGDNLVSDFGFYAGRVTIGNFVWVDTNGNGVQDSGEPGIPGVGLTLIGTNDVGVAVTNYTTTDGNGLYLFSEAPGTYSVSVDATNANAGGPLAGYVTTATGQGTSATDSNPSPSGTTPTTLASGGSDLTLDFGYYLPVTVGNFVWVDTNGNGVQDSGEPGIPGVGLTLIGTNGVGVAVTNYTTTDGNGLYLFTEAPGTYSVSVDATNANAGGPLAGYVTTVTGQGTTATDSNPSPSGTTPTTLLSGGSDLTLDFGFAPLFSLGNRVFADNGAGGGVANNGLQDGTEPGLAGVVVALFAADLNGNPTGSMLQTTNTDANGWYRFDGLVPGSYVPVVDVSGSGAVLAGLVSSTGYSTNTTLAGDLYDHGQDTPLDGLSVLPDGIAGVAVTLGTSLQPQGEATGSGAGANGPTGDAGDNLVSDFGFVSCSCVDGYVYVDSLTSGSIVGRYDPGVDLPIPFVTVFVTNSQGGPVIVQTDTNGYFKAYVPPGVTWVNVNTNSPSFPPGLVLTSLPDGENPSTVIVTPCDCARDNTGYLRSSPTLASLLSVTAQADAGVVTVRWVSAAEVGTVAYDLQRQTANGHWTTVNADSVFALNSIVGGSYAVVDAEARARQTYQYQILEHLENGDTKVHGPYAVTVTGEPGVPVTITSLALEGGQLRLSWQGEAGSTYLLERSVSLDGSAAWLEVPLTEPETTSALVPVEAATGFFRVFRLP
jgi:protocatechuate 3,4-dioxygenase beta subunit